MTFTFVGQAGNRTLEWFCDGLKRILGGRGHVFHANAPEDIGLVFNLVDPLKPKPYRRHAQATFVVSLFVVDKVPADPIQLGYPVLVRSLANLVILLVEESGPEQAPHTVEAHFITIERGHYTVTGGGEDFFERVYARLEPLATSQLVINNEFEPDLPENLWGGTATTAKLAEAGRRLSQLQLWPAPFPLEDVLSERDRRHLLMLFGVGGLSYGNLSARHADTSFWMSASGVDKGKLATIGEHILLVKRYDPARNAMILSVPPGKKWRRVSVDAIEHWMIYTEHPRVGAIVHVHAWMDGVPSTPMNYPCGTIQLARAVAELVRRAEDPSRAVIGLKNHGLTITGPDLDDIFERVEGRIIPQVPMS